MSLRARVRAEEPEQINHSAVAEKYEKQPTLNMKMSTSRPRETQTSTSHTHTRTHNRYEFVFPQFHAHNVCAGYVHTCERPTGPTQN